MSDAYLPFLVGPQHAALAAYVLPRVQEDAGCLRWIGYCFNGHPAGTVGGRKLLIRRELWIAAHGPIPAGRIIRCTCETPLCVACLELTSYQRLGKQLGAQGVMSGPVRSAKIAATKRAGRQAKITQEDARTIRCSTDPERVLSERYGISMCTVGRIRRGEVRREFAGNVWAGLRS